MKVFAVAGTSDIATVYMADMDGKMIEFVEALQPPHTRDERWILMVSTLFGCPVRCQICDAGGQYQGKPSAEQILAQIDYMVTRWYPDRRVPAAKFKIQFARMGEPALNMAVLDALEQLPRRFDAPGLMPSVSTIAPHGTDAFFERLADVKDRLYAGGRFQFQFSLHTTDAALRGKLIPVRTWTFDRMAAYGERFLRPGDRKITLNFALAAGSPVEPEALLRYFDPQKFLVKITPVNPTCRAVQHGLVSYIDPHAPESGRGLAERLRAAGYEVIVSIGEAKENQIGSNCGQYVLKYLESREAVKDGYTYEVETIPA
ncbi:MAG: 23S rRNA (adenine2503-C2)-methyltransferase [Anaerolineaceae bacterium]|nr:MAG: 23S rRNA (adenine2503-C2)-methyltransferase [Anaerolineaceae bacterium]